MWTSDTKQTSSRVGTLASETLQDKQSSQVPRDMCSCVACR